MGSKLELVEMNSKQTVFKGNMTSDTYAMTTTENTQFAYKVKAREYFFTQSVKLTNAKDQPIVDEKIVLTKIEIDRKIIRKANFI